MIPGELRKVHLESLHESKAFFVLLADPAVRTVFEQPQAVPYTDGSGIRRWHTFDFLVELRSGRRHAVAVKPTSRAKSSGLHDIVELIRKQSLKGFADGITVLTGEHLTDTRVHNARLIVEARRRRNDDDLALLRSVAESHWGAFPIAELLDLCPGLRNGIYSVVNLIDDQVLAFNRTERLNIDTHVRLASRT